MTAIHYKVKSKLIRKIGKDGEIDFLSFEEEFTNKNPILARIAAFRLYQNYVDVLVSSNVSDKEARQNFSTFLGPSVTKTISIGDYSFETHGVIEYGLGVFLVINKPIPGDIRQWNEGTELMIHGIGFSDLFGRLDDADKLIRALTNEIDQYDFYNYDTKGYKITVTYCDPEEWEEGRENEPSLVTILQTPFDWAGYDEPYWWGQPNEENEVESVALKTIEELITDGESKQVEFKPSLLYNFKTKKPGIGVKYIIAKCICAFLNTVGGYLIIGLHDNGDTLGLSFDFSLSDKSNPKDFLRLELDQLLSHFFPRWLPSSLISSEFISRDSKEIFVITVLPCRSGPVFLNGRDGKEFFKRGEASTRQIIDIEDIANYCLGHWPSRT